MSKELKNWHEIVSEDFKMMHETLRDIEIKLMGVDPKKQYQFYRPVRDMIFEAWKDACNPDDNYLFPKPPTPTNE